MANIDTLIPDDTQPEADEDTESVEALRDAELADTPHGSFDIDIDEDDDDILLYLDLDPSSNDSGPLAPGIQLPDEFICQGCHLTAHIAQRSVDGLCRDCT